MIQSGFVPLTGCVARACAAFHWAAVTPDNLKLRFSVCLLRFSKNRMHIQCLDGCSVVASSQQTRCTSLTIGEHVSAALFVSILAVHKNKSRCVCRFVCESSGPSCAARVLVASSALSVSWPLWSVMTAAWSRVLFVPALSMRQQTSWFQQRHVLASVFRQPIVLLKEAFYPRVSIKFLLIAHFESQTIWHEVKSLSK